MRRASSRGPSSLLVLFVPLVACSGGGGGDGDPEEPTDPAAKSTDLIWDSGTWDDFNWAAPVDPPS